MGKCDLRFWYPSCIVGFLWPICIVLVLQMLQHILSMHWFPMDLKVQQIPPLGYNAFPIECSWSTHFKVTLILSPSFLQGLKEAAYPSDISGGFCWNFIALSDCQTTCRVVNGVYQVYKQGSMQTEFPVPGPPEEFFTDLHLILKFVQLGPVKTFCYQRLNMLEQKFKLHVMMNADKEFLAQRSAPHRDFYNIRKVGSSCCYLPSWIMDSGTVGSVLINGPRNIPYFLQPGATSELPGIFCCSWPSVILAQTMLKQSW